MTKVQILKLVVTFVSAGLAALAAAGAIPVSQEQILAMTNLASLALGASYVNAKH